MDDRVLFYRDMDVKDARWKSLNRRIVEALDIYDVGNSRQALVLLNGALEESREKGGKSELAIALNNIAAIIIGKGEFDNAITALGEALTIFSESKDKKGIGICLNNRADVMWKTGNAAIAQELLGKAVQLFTEVRYSEGLIKSWVVARICGYLNP